MNILPCFKRIALRTFVCLPCVLLALPARAENLDQLMIRVFPSQNPQSPRYIGYERVDAAPAQNDAERYLILDFRFTQRPDEPVLQASVDSICKALLHDTELLRDLSGQGYEMVSVAFDQQSQYDCL